MPRSIFSTDRLCRESQRGSVVIFVLGIILLAAFLITRLMDRAVVELAVESKAAKRTDLRQEAMSALEASFAVLADESSARSGLHQASEGWDRPLALMEYQPPDGYVIEVLVEDESSKLSLPVADETALRGFLEAIECPATAQDRLVDSLLAWTKPDHLSAEGDRDTIVFAAAPLPYAAPHRALRSFEELRAIPATRELFFDEVGDWNELGRRFQAGVSLFPFPASNVNSARPEVLLAYGVDEGRVSTMTAARQNSDTRSSFYRSPAELAGAWGRDGAPPGLGTQVQCLHITVIAKYGARDYRLDAWVQPPGVARRGAAAPRESQTSTQGNTTPEVPSVRNNPRKSVDYPFQILELRENPGT